jgi:hypothetical protein
MVCRARTTILQRQLVSFFLLTTMTRILHIKLCLSHCHVPVNIQTTLLCQKMCGYEQERRSIEHLPI